MTSFLSSTVTLNMSGISESTLTTTLTDNTIQYGSKKTFDVWAYNSQGEKVKSTVKLNGLEVQPTWDDNEKTSYTLLFTQEGENLVTVSAQLGNGKKKDLLYHINYIKVSDGTQIGTATWSIEAFTIGCGYIVYPIELPIYEGENAADALLRLLDSNGLVGYYSGTADSSFYLAYISSGNAHEERYNGYRKSKSTGNSKKLDLFPAIPETLVPHLKSSMTFFDPEDYQKNWSNHLGEFVITNGSGWMYSINNIFPNVGFSDSYLSDNDVVRIQFTLGYGADIGGFGAIGSTVPGTDILPTGGYYPVANKDELTKAICKAHGSKKLSDPDTNDAYDKAIDVAITLDASQNRVDIVTRNLLNALNANQENKLPETTQDSKPNSNKAENSSESIVETSASYSSDSEINSTNIETDKTTIDDEPKVSSNGIHNAQTSAPVDTEKEGSTDKGNTEGNKEKATAKEEISSNTVNEFDNSDKNKLETNIGKNNKNKTLYTVLIAASAFIVTVSATATVCIRKRKKEKSTVKKENNTDE